MTALRLSVLLLLSCALARADALTGRDVTGTGGDHCLAGSAATSPPGKCSDGNRPLSFALAGSALLVPYYFGVFESLIEVGAVDASTTFGGISGGAVTSMLICAGHSPQRINTSFSDMFAWCRNNIEWCGSHLSGHAKKRVYDPLLTAETVNGCVDGRVTVGLTRLNPLSDSFQDATAMSVNRFNGAADIVEALLASSFLSCFVAPHTYTTFRGEPVIDGAYKGDFVDICPPNTECIRISAFVVGDRVTEGNANPDWHCFPRASTTGELHNWPQFYAEEWNLPTSCDYDHNEFQTPTNPHIYPGKYTTIPYSRAQWHGLAMCLGSQEDVNNMYKAGRADALAWWSERLASQHRDEL